MQPPHQSWILQKGETINCKDDCINVQQKALWWLIINHLSVLGEMRKLSTMKQCGKPATKQWLKATGNATALQWIIDSSQDQEAPLRARSFLTERPGTRPNPPGSERPGTKTRPTKIAVRLSLAWNRIRPILDILCDLRPGLLPRLLTSGTKSPGSHLIPS